ncbi:MAG: cation diffusion facilitator family transporter [Fibrobacterota bacterium]
MIKEKVAAVSIAANLILAGGKIAVGLFSGSAAVLAEGFHSFMDVFSSAIGYIGIRMAEKPGDEKHPYGHYKFEVLGGVIITLILLATGAGIIYEAYLGFLDPAKVKISRLAFVTMILSAIINEIMARVKIHYGKKENSISLLSDGFHSRADVYASTAVFAGLFLTKYWIYTDSLLALLIGVYIIAKSFTLGKAAVDSLLDTSAGEAIESRIKTIVKAQNIEMASLKTQKKGSSITANIEINLASSLKVEEATKITNGLRGELMEAIEGLQYVAVQITSHELLTGYYKPDFRRGFGWQRTGGFPGNVEEARRAGPGGYCVCPKCGYQVPHKRGVPCPTLVCPKCKINMVR